MTLIQAIALLCQLHVGSLDAVERKQIACQAYFARCTSEFPMKSIDACIIERQQ